MKSLTGTLILSFCFFAFACNHPQKATQVARHSVSVPEIYSKKYVYTSIISLIANPKEHDNLRVRLKGYLHLEVEHNALYLNEDDWIHEVTKNAIWVELSTEQMHDDKITRCNGKLVLLDGTYNSNNNGDIGMYSGELEHIAMVHDPHNN
jgi:hypothetical protein